METVILEYVSEDDSSEVAVIPFDRGTKEVIGDPIEILSRLEAIAKYKVVGYVHNGEVSLDDDSDDDWFEDDDDEWF